MASARRRDARDEPSALRDDDRFHGGQGAHEVADDAFDAALLESRKEMDDFHFSQSSLTQAQGLVQVLRWRPR